MAATLAYLHEWGWHTNSLYEWHRNETAFMTEAHIDIRQPWWQVEEAIIAEAKQQRQSRFAMAAGKTANLWSATLTGP